MLCYSCSLWPPTLQWVHHFTFHPFSSPHPLRASAHSLTHLYIYHALYSVIKMFNMRSHSQTKKATATDVLQITSGNPVIFNIGPRILHAVIISDNPFSNLFFISLICSSVLIICSSFLPCHAGHRWPCSPQTLSMEEGGLRQWLHSVLHDHCGPRFLPPDLPPWSGHCESLQFMFSSRFTLARELWVQIFWQLTAPFFFYQRAFVAIQRMQWRRQL